MLNLFLSSLGNYTHIPAEPVDDYTTSSNEHLFWVVGDSIANGTNARTGEAKPNPNGALKEWNGTTSNVVSDTTTANDGSQYPQFAIGYKQATGKDVVLCEDALGGAEWVLNNNNQHWNTDGILYTPARDKCQAMLAHYGKKLKGVLIILGINDARGTATMSNIQIGMNSLIDRINADFNTPNIYIVQIGRSESTTNGGFTERVRDVQKLLDNADANLVYNDGGSYGLGLIQRYANVKKADELERYVALGLYSGDNLHLSQAGNDLLGRTLATYIAGAG